MFKVFLFTLFLCVCMGCFNMRTRETIIERMPEMMQPIDWRNKIPSESFKPCGEGEWISDVITPPFAFDELIYSWTLRVEKDQAFRLYLKAIFGPKDETAWLYGGFWGDLKEQISGREKPEFDRGLVDMDWLKLKASAVSYQFKIESTGERLLAKPPSLVVISTDNHPAPGEYERHLPDDTGTPAPARVLDIPLRRQQNSRGESMKDRCQSAALASALEYYGKSVPLEEIVRYTHDPEYNYPGLWPRIIGAAEKFGCEGYIERFRTWDSVQKAVAENKVILCSIRMAEGLCKAPPYPKMGNHIVALNGITDDGRVVVTDSYLGKSGNGYLCQWLREDFEKVWMETKGGIAMVICPPPGAKEKIVQNIPPFPENSRYPTGDDH